MWISSFLSKSFLIYNKNGWTRKNTYLRISVSSKYFLNKNFNKKKNYITALEMITLKKVMPIPKFWNYYYTTWISRISFKYTCLKVISCMNYFASTNPLHLYNFTKLLRVSTFQGATNYFRYIVNVYTIRGMLG